MFMLKNMYGVEMNPPNNKLPGFMAQIVKKTAELAKVFDRDKQLVILNDREEAVALQEYYISKNIFQDFYPLLYLSPNSEITPSFSDYGFVSQNNEYFLYKKMVSCFTIRNGEQPQIEMAILQMEEHLICKEGELFFVDHMSIELMEGIARAYNIELTFLDE